MTQEDETFLMGLMVKEINRQFRHTPKATATLYGKTIIFRCDRWGMTTLNLISGIAQSCQLKIWDYAIMGIDLSSPASHNDNLVTAHIYTATID